MIDYAEKVAEEKVKTSKKIHALVKNGFLPNRGKEPYSGPAIMLANCFEHACFNFTNQQLVENVSDEGSYLFGEISPFPTNTFFNQISKVIVDVGLTFKPCEINDILERNEWKVAIYFSNFDFHFLKQEEDKSWSGKNGWVGSLELYEDLPNQIFRYNAPKGDSSYKLFGLYSLKNPNAKEDNEKQVVTTAIEKTLTN